MKKIIALVLLSVLVLGSCGGNTEVSDTVSETVSEEISEVSENSTEQIILPADKTQLLATAENLINTDINLMRVVAGGLLSEGKLTDTYQKAEGTYAEYTVLSAMASSTYASEEIAQAMLSMPRYGEKSVIDREGETYYKYTYINDFAADIRNVDVELIAYDDTRAYFSVNAYDKPLEMSMVNRYGRWYLENSIYLAYLEAEEKAQADEGWESNIYLGSRQNVGSMASLQGKVLILNVFLNDTYTSWTDANRKTVEDNIDRACEWLISKSREYSGASLTIDTQSLFYVHADTVPTNYQMAFLDIMFQNTVYVDVNGYVSQNTPTGYDNVCVLFHVWKNGDDYCIPCDTNNTDYLTYYGERAMFYYSKNAGHEPSSYAAKILQLAGAEKLYESDYKKGIEYLFENDLMLQKNTLKLPLQNYSVSPLTAFSIGWSEGVDVQLIPYTNLFALQGEQ